MIGSADWIGINQVESETRLQTADRWAVWAAALSFLRTHAHLPTPTQPRPAISGRNLRKNISLARGFNRDYRQKESAALYFLVHPTRLFGELYMSNITSLYLELGPTPYVGVRSGEKLQCIILWPIQAAAFMVYTMRRLRSVRSRRPHSRYPA